jgi:hypothetical protein
MLLGRYATAPEGSSRAGKVSAEAFLSHLDLAHGELGGVSSAAGVAAQAVFSPTGRCADMERCCGVYASRGYRQMVLVQGGRRNAHAFCAAAPFRRCAERCYGIT